MGLFRHILLATDGSAASEQAARLAVELARVHGARLTAVFVIDTYPWLVIGDTNPMGLQAYLSAARELAATAHGKVSELCNAQGQPAVALEVKLLEGVTPVRGILETAAHDGADLIVAGSHGRSGLAKAMLGSVASGIVAQANVPVLIARGPH